MRIIGFLTLLWVSQMLAAPVQLEYRGLMLNGNLATTGSGQSNFIFLIVHGTWAHHGMEIITSLQELLAESGQDSLAITLSLGIDDRKGFLQCKSPIKANHGNAAAEINRWVEYLESRSRQIVVVGHSRGGNQVALFNRAYPSSAVTHLVLIAPMSWNAKQSARHYEEKFGVSLEQVLEQATAGGSRLIRADLLQCRDLEVMATSFVSYYGREPNRNTPELLQSADRPVLVFQGSEDVLAAGYRSQEALVESNSLVEGYWIDGADHFFRDLYADELVQYMLDWLC